jgi:UDP-glucose 4-epimerase
MRILITGSEGFLGKVLCNKLQNEGHEIIRYDISIGKDILDFKQLYDDMSKCDVCIHLAAIADLYVAEVNPELTMNINVKSTEKLIQFANELEVRILFASTVCAYGNNGEDVSSENSPLAPTEVYAKSKVEAEKLFMGHLERHSILRLATFYGPNMRSSLAVSIFIDAVVNDEEIRIHGNGLQTRCYTYVTDISSGIITVLNSKTNGIFNISSDEETSVLGLIEMISNIIGKEAKIKFVDDRFGQITRSKIASEKLRELGWKPNYNLKSGLLKCILFISNLKA